MYHLIASSTSDKTFSKISSRSPVPASALLSSIESQTDTAFSTTTSPDLMKAGDSFGPITGTDFTALTMSFWTSGELETHELVPIRGETIWHTSSISFIRESSEESSRFLSYCIGFAISCTDTSSEAQAATSKRVAGKMDFIEEIDYLCLSFGFD